MPVFIIADLAFNAPIRVSFVESLWLRGLYYLACVVCGLVCYIRPASTMINVLICGSVLVLTFHRSEAAILVGKGGKRN